MSTGSPNTADLHRAAERALKNGQLREAHQHCLSILAQDRRHADAWFICGVIAAKNGQLEKALQIFRNAVSLAPQNAEYQAELAKYLLAKGQTREALECSRKCLALEISSVPTLNTLGTVLSHCQEHESALLCYRAATTELAKPNSSSALSKDFQADLYFNYAVSLQFSGEFDTARNAYEKALVLQPALFKAHSALATLGADENTEKRLARLEILRDTIGDSTDQLHLGHAMATEYENRSAYNEAFESLAWAKKAHALKVNYRIETDIELFNTAVTSYNENSPVQTEDQTSGFDNSEAIFIVGMPRTGTTLLEQILSSHSDVFAAGELQNFPVAVKQLSGTQSPDTLDVETLQHASRVRPAQLGETYIESTRPRTGATARFIDKLPLNFLYLGLIRKALPNAKIICLRRDPMDTCVSNYRQLFARNFQYYYYNLDLIDCARYYIAFDRLMQQWKTLLPGAIHEVHYEQLVSHTEAEARSLLSFCQLDWQDECLDFHQRDTSVATPSAVQVRKGIYKSSVALWRRYEAQVEPAYELLRSAGYYD